MFLGTPALATAISVWFVIVVLASRVESATRDEKQRLKRGFELNRKVAHGFGCNAPPPRAILVDEIVEAGPAEMYTPAMTVLHRCDAGAGCCPMGMSCQPRATEVVELVFHVTVIENLRDRGSFRSVSATNHTACWCRETRRANLRHVGRVASRHVDTST